MSAFPATTSPVAVLDGQMAPALLRLHEAARAAGLQCLSTQWISWTAAYVFQCTQGHQFTRVASSAIYHSVVCQACAGEQRLRQLQQAAHAKGGKCLESVYLGSAPHRFECAHGHQWKVTPSHLLNEHRWCSHCASREHSKRLMRKDGLEALQRMAESRGGRLLSTIYNGMAERYLLQCAHGHQWETEGVEIARGTWCRLCAYENKRQHYRLADGLERLQGAAIAKKGVCLSGEYTGLKTYYQFRCKHGHEWKSTGHRILRGSWCPTCIRTEKSLGMEIMRKIAQERGGACLSEQYQNAATKLHWECHRGHRWHAVPAAIRRGHWCPECAHMNHISKPNSKARLKYLSKSVNGL